MSLNVARSGFPPCDILSYDVKCKHVLSASLKKTFPSFLQMQTNGGGWCQTFVFGEGLEDNFFFPSHVLCTIKSQIGGGGGEAMGGMMRMGGHGPPGPP